MTLGQRIVTICMLTLLFIEGVLLDLKYQIFSGSGFLQSSPLSSVSDKVSFVVLVLSAYLLLYFICTYIVKGIIRRILPTAKKPAFIAANCFIFFYGLSLMVHYKLHAYVADHVDQKVIQAIAGNSLENAILYVKDEILFLILPLLIYVVIFVVLLKKISPEVSSARFTIHKKAIFITSTTLFSLLVLVGNHPIIINANRSIAFSAFQNSGHILTDWDLDGSSYVSTPADIAPFNSNIFWGAIDIPGNNIDENGLGGDLPKYDQNIKITESYKLPTQYKHLAVIVSESTRSDILEQQLNGQYIAPNLRALAATGSTVSDAFSHAGFTANSLYTLFSGKLLYTGKTESIFQKASRNNFEISVISGQDETWGELDTRLGTRENANFFYDPQVDPEKRVYPSKLPSSIKLADETLVETFERRLDTLDTEKRQLFYFNLQSGHFPYYHKRMPLNYVETSIPRNRINIDNKKWLTDTYWNAMAYMDSNLGRIIGALEEKGILAETLVVFMGDHGESLFHDNFLGHGHNINRDQLQIPLVLSAPDITFKAPIGITDIHRWLDSFVQQSQHTPATIDKNGDCVFMHTGYLPSPAQIGQICTGEENPSVYTVSFDDYRSGSKLEGATSKINLIHRWEQLLFNEHK